jgi:putative NIF3 family GTP cyclohydrolase 1 type 2
VKLREIYETAVKIGIAADPRGKAGVNAYLALTKRRYDDLSDYLKDACDKEEFTNPYIDTRIYVGDPETEVKTIIGGIDMNVGEVLLADRLREKGVKIDAIYTHHPEGWGLIKLDKVMEMQADVWASLGVSINAGEMLMDERRTAVRRRLMPENADQAIDAARLLGIPFFSAHTPTDNLVTQYLNRYFDERQPLLVEDVRKLLFDVPEFRLAAQKGAGPYVEGHIVAKKAGKVWVDMTGGTEGPVKIMEKLADQGVGTIVGMHMSPDLRKEAEGHNIHVVIAGHMASDSVGINLFLDVLERKGVKTIPTSGLIRVHRDKDGKVVKEEPGSLPA